ncbi:MAG TPA: ferritin-like domain-containing protein, partial [Tissierellales bacterium]|nr:ferritin-like domain-containing protein [Tissierellales bacterium]
IEPEKFSRENALEIVKEDLESMRELATDIRNAADEEGDFETVAMFEDYVAYYSLKIWFVKSMLK